ncbi:MAG TPA: hypothetical protein VED40_14590 [Azospirillaceae bacterium]|nr:hypothetical protein [Azospirillaceae bacterium]
MRQAILFILVVLTFSWSGAAIAACEAISSEMNPDRLVTVEEDGKRLCLAGQIDEAMYEAVRSIDLAHVSEVVVNSMGGEVHAAVKIGRLIHERGMSLIVRGLCASSCGNYLFMASPRPSFEKDATLAFHGAPSDRLYEDLGCAVGGTSTCNEMLAANILRDITDSNTFLNLIAAHYGRKLAIIRHPPARYGVTKDWKTNMWVPNQAEMDDAMGYHLPVPWEKKGTR